MTVMITEVWDALGSVGVEDEKPRRAAAAVAHYRAGLNERIDAGFAETERRDDALRQELRAEIGGLRQEMRDGHAALSADVQLINWMVGAAFAGVVAIPLRLFLQSEPRPCPA